MRTRTPEELARDVAIVIKRNGPTKVCTLCKLEKSRADFNTIQPYGKNSYVHSASRCRKCLKAVTNERRKWLVAHKDHPSYQRLRAAQARQSGRYRAKRRVRLDAIDREAMSNPLSRKLTGL